MSDEGYNYDAEFYKRMLKLTIKSVEYIESNNPPQVNTPPENNNNAMSNYAKSTFKKIISRKKIHPTGIVKGTVKAGLNSTSIKKATI